MKNILASLFLLASNCSTKSVDKPKGSEYRNDIAIKIVSCSYTYECIESDLDSVCFFKWSGCPEWLQ